MHRPPVFTPLDLTYMTQKHSNLALVRGSKPPEGRMAEPFTDTDTAMKVVEEARDEVAMLRLRLRDAERRLDDAEEQVRHESNMRRARAEGMQARIRHNSAKANPHDEQGSQREQALHGQWFAGFHRANEDEILLNFLAMGQELLDDATISADGETVMVDVHLYHVAMHALNRAREFAAF